MRFANESKPTLKRWCEINDPKVNEEAKEEERIKNMSFDETLDHIFGVNDD